MGDLVIKADLRTMKSMLKKINAIGVDEVIMTIGDGKIHGRYIDPAHVALLDIEMKLEGCGEKKIEFAMDITTLISRIYPLPMGNIKKRDEPENQLKIKMLEKKGELTGFKFFHPMLSFEKSLMNASGIPTAKPMKELLKNMDVTANINTKQFKIFLKIADEETTYIALIANQKKNTLQARFITDEKEVISTDLTYSLGGIEGIDLQFLKKSNAKIKTLFSIDYMLNIINLIDAPIIKIGLKTDKPLIVWWNEKGLLSGSYLLAPRIQSE